MCRYYEQYRRYNYTTPKSYLELISLYKSLLARKRDELRAAKQRLENGARRWQGRCLRFIGQAACRTFRKARPIDWPPIYPPPNIRAAGVEKISQASDAVELLRVALLSEQVVVEEKKAATVVRPTQLYMGGTLRVQASHCSARWDGIRNGCRPRPPASSASCPHGLAPWALVVLPTRPFTLYRWSIPCFFLQALIESIGQEKAVADEAVEASRGDEESAAELQAQVEAVAAECARDLGAAEPVIKVRV